jgi:acyl-CoA thioesterase
MADRSTTGHVMLDEHLLTPDGRFYGGAVLGLSLAAMETATGRPSLWANVQFTSTVGPGARVDVEVDLSAVGRRTSQLRVTGRHLGEEVFCATGSVAEPKPDGPRALYHGMPEVVHPESAPPIDYRPGFPDTGRRAGFASLRDAPLLDGRPHPPGRLTVWAQLPPGHSTSPALVAYVADRVPMALSRSLGTNTGGVSLDNTLRVADMEPTDWVLLDFHLHQIGNGFGHGTVLLWSRRGGLLAIASQTASMRPPVAGGRA